MGMGITTPPSPVTFHNLNHVSVLTYQHASPWLAGKKRTPSPWSLIWISDQLQHVRTRFSKVSNHSACILRTWAIGEVMPFSFAQTNVANSLLADNGDRMWLSKRSSHSENYLGPNTKIRNLRSNIILEAIDHGRIRLKNSPLCHSLECDAGD